MTSTSTEPQAYRDEHGDLWVPFPQDGTGGWSAREQSYVVDGNPVMTEGESSGPTHYLIEDADDDDERCPIT